MKVRRLLFTLGLLVALGSVGVLNAKDVVHDGTFKGGTWAIYDDGELRIARTSDGAIPDYEDSSAPWAAYSEEIKWINLDESKGKITRIGKWAFRDMEVDSIKQGNRPANHLELESLGKKAFNSFNVREGLYISGNKEMSRHTAISATPFLSFKDMETVWEYGLSGSHAMIDLGPDIKMLKAGSLKCNELWHVDGTPSIFMQATTPPEWQRIVNQGESHAGEWIAYIGMNILTGGITYWISADRAGASKDAVDANSGYTWAWAYGSGANFFITESDYEYPFGDKPKNYDGEVIVVVPPSLLSKYQSFYQKEHPETHWGYLTSYYTGEHSKKTYNNTASCGRFVAGEPLYDSNGDFQGWWYADYKNEKKVIHIGFLTSVPSYRENVAPWIEEIKDADILYIHNARSIDDNAFKDGKNLGSVKDVYLDYSVNKIGDNAFLGCTKLEGVYDYSGTPTVKAGNSAFQGCSNLQSVYRITFSSIGESCFEDCPKIYGITVASRFSRVPNRAFYNCSKFNDVNLTYVDSIGTSAFEGSGVKRIAMPYVRGIGDRAFRNCKSLEEVNFCNTTSNHINTGHNMFEGCTALRNIYVPDVKRLAVYTHTDAFKDLSMQDIILHIDPEIYYLGYSSDYNFGQFTPDFEFTWKQAQGTIRYGCVHWQVSETGVLTIDPVGYMGNYGLYSKDFYIPDYESGDKTPWAPYRKYITKIVIGSVADSKGKYYSIYRIGANAFAFPNSQVTDVHIPRGCTYIGEKAFFNNSNLVSIHIEDVEEIGSYAFAHCTSMPKISLGDNLQKAGDYIFQDCPNLERVNISSIKPAEVTKYTFAQIGNEQNSGAPRRSPAAVAATDGQQNVTLSVPGGALNNYLTADYWNQFNFDVSDLEHGKLKFAGKYGEGMWILWEDSTMTICANRDLTYQEASEVQKNTNFSEAVVTGTKVLIFQGKLESVGKGFSGMFKAWSATSGFCNLERVSLPETVKRIYPSTFEGCRKLSEINITQVDTIDAYAFSNCGLMVVSLATAKSVGAFAFSYCQNLSSVSLGDDTQLGNNIFTGCTALQAVDLGKGILGSGMFVDCQNLSWASYSGSELPAATFSGCKNLSVLNLGTQLRKIGESAFTGCKMDTIYISTPNPSEMITKEEIIDWAYVDDDYNSYTHTIYDPFGYVTTDTRTGELRRKSVVDRTKIHVIVPETYASIYRKADFWKEMIINDQTRDDLEFPITFALGKKGSGVIDVKGNLKAVVYGDMSDKASNALVSWDNYISDKIEFDYSTRSVSKDAFSWMTHAKRQAAVAARIRRSAAGMEADQQIEEALATPMTITFGTLMQAIEKGAFYNELLDATTVFNCYAPKPITIKSGAFNWEVLNANGKKPKLHIVNDPEVIEAWNKETYASVWKEHFEIVADLSAQKAPMQYTITFVDGLSQGDVPVVISEQVVDLGKSAVAPEAPAHIGYVFSGWDGDFTDVNEDRTIIANYTYTTHDVFFWVGQNVWEKQTVEHGGAALEPTKTPEMPGYVFDHWGWWSEKHDNVFKDFNVQAIWKKLVKATGITLDPDIKTINTNTAELQAGITFQITPTIVPAKAADQQLIWSSNNTDVATVDQKGLVTITMATNVYNDVAIIKAMTTDGSELYAECVVDVTNEDNVMVPVYATSVRILGSKEITIYRGQTSDDPTKVRVVVEPSNYNQGIFAFLWNADMQDFEPGGNPDVINIADATDDEGNPLKGTFDIYAPFYDPTLYPNWKPYDVNIFFRVQTGSDPENIKHDTLKVHVVQDIIFTENNAQNIPITYRVIDNDTKTCETYSSQDPETSAWTPFMPYEVSGDNGYVSIPTKAREYNVVRVNGVCASENITTMEFDNGIQHIAGAPAVPMIKKVILPKSYKRLDNSIFANNDKLKDVYIYAKTAPKEPFAKSYGVGYTNAFDQIGGGHATLHVVKGCKAEYNVKPWTDWFETITDDLSATHVVTFLDYDGTQIDKQDVAYREAAVAPEVPFHDGRTFKAWDKAFDCITGDLTVTALYDVAKYTVTFVDWNGSKLQETQVEFGESVSAPADPSRNGYVFKGWDKKSDFITESITINAVYAKLYTVSFIDWNDVELSTESVEEGQSAHEPNVPIRAGYRFTGWDVDFYNVQSDLIVQAQYVQEAQGVEYVKQDAPAPAVRKVLINGQLYIIRGDMIFNAQGARVK